MNFLILPARLPPPDIISRQIDMSQPRGEMYCSRVSSTRATVMSERLNRPFQIYRVPQDDSRRKQGQTAGAVTLVFRPAVAHFPEPLEEGERVHKGFKGMRYRPDAHWDYVIPPGYDVDQRPWELHAIRATNRSLL